MSWQVVARQDGALAIEPRSTKLLLALPVVVLLGVAYFYPVFGADPITTARFAGYASGSLTTVIPLVGVLLGYNAVVSERESGSIRLTLSLPVSRWDVVAGTVASRVGLVGGALLVGVAAAGGLVVYPYGELALAGLVGFAAATVGFGALWTCIGIAASLSVATKRRALVLAFGLFVVLVVVWDGLTGTVILALDSAGLLGNGTPAPLEFVVESDPSSLYERVVTGFVDPSVSLDGPWYLGRWVSLLSFVGWLLVPLFVAARRFSRRDIV